MGSCVSTANKRVDPLRATEPIGPAEICEQTCDGGSPATPLTGTPDTSGESITLGDFAQLFGARLVKFEHRRLTGQREWRHELTHTISPTIC